MSTWVLLLNDMRSPKIEILTPVVRSSTKDGLLRFVEENIVEPYKDDNWNKVFKKGSLLEWYNPPSSDKEFIETGSAEDWMDRARIDWQNKVGILMVV